MSRLANTPITIPAGVTVTLGAGKDDKQVLSMSNGKVTEEWAVCAAVKVAVEDSTILLTMSDKDRENKFNRSMLGTDYRHIKNAVEGLATPFETVLEIHGLGYRAKLQGTNLVLALGKSHDDIVAIPENVLVETKGEKEIICRSHSKKLLGDFVAEVCSKRKPDAYKAKGVRIRGRHYRTKSD